MSVCPRPRCTSSDGPPSAAITPVPRRPSASRPCQRPPRRLLHRRSTTSFTAGFPWAVLGPAPRCRRPMPDGVAASERSSRSPAPVPPAADAHSCLPACLPAAAAAPCQPRPPPFARACNHSRYQQAVAAMETTSEMHLNVLLMLLLRLVLLLLLPLLLPLLLLLLLLLLVLLVLLLLLLQHTSNERPLQRPRLCAVTQSAAEQRQNNGRTAAEQRQNRPPCT